MKEFGLRFIYSVSVYVVMLACLLAASEGVTGAPSSLYGYYRYTYDGVGTAVIIRSRTGGRSRTYHIAYSYEVDHRYYQSTKVRFSANYKNVAASTVRKYPLGQEVRVYYSTENPRFAVLEKDKPDSWIWGQLIAALLLGVFFAWFLIWERRGRFAAR